MTYSEATTQLRETLEACGTPFQVESANTPGVFEFSRLVFGDVLSTEIAKAGWVGSSQIPWVAEDFHLYPLSEMEVRQRGYSVHAHTLLPIKDWDADRYVIGDWGADPLSIDRQGGISNAVHGAGKWIYEPLTDNLPQFLDIFARYVRWLALDRGGALAGKQEDYEVSEATKTEIRTRFLDELPAAQADAFLRFFVP